ncbi:galactose-1-phosphate uridylyltransferase [Thermosulfurimonas marina]|uniref:galactose-1-phosphate uridylyltransferase n=1 Tax=Thermosulfurimonas marina TaxID=2047767 RepID=UPI00144AC3C8|nr:galactose-1-phosphate uridylyltransferase [Thermosulfurimonas marina]
MPEIREDPLSGRLSLVAPERGRRPHDFQPLPETAETGPCPFCPGNEHLTPPELLRLTGPEGDWSVRVVPNKFAALVPGKADPPPSDLFVVLPGVGRHEVIIETPEHERALAELSPSQVLRVLEAFRQRKEAFQAEGWRYGLFFKNHGARAGASRRHSHSQVLALPFLPPLLKREFARLEEFRHRKGRCLFCEMVEKERREPRKILESENFLAAAAFAPRQPLETWILHKAHGRPFDTLEERELLEFAEVLLHLLRALNRIVPNLPYNFFLHLEPLKGPFPEDFHWHLELVPALTRVAGFEWGAEAYIVPVAPEEAAAWLREA